MPLHTEKELLLQIANGDEEAFGVIFKHYFHHMYSLLLKYTGRNIDAEDIVQHVFVIVWQKRELLAEVEKFDKWLYTITLNEFRMRFRKNRTSDRYRRYILELGEEGLETPEEMLISKQKAAMLNQAIADLAPKQREAYLLSRENGLTYAEIAVEMNIAPTTVKEHISRALQALRSRMLRNPDELMLIVYFSLGNVLPYAFWCILLPMG